MATVPLMRARAMADTGGMDLETRCVSAVGRDAERAMAAEQRDRRDAQAALLAARERIRELEAELAAHEQTPTRGEAILVARTVARECGYAVAIHGSMRRDLDLLAAPWTEAACGALELAEAIARQLPGVCADRGTAKPHGRVAFVIHPRYCGPTHDFTPDHWPADDRTSFYIDLSVMPRVAW